MNRIAVGMKGGRSVLVGLLLIALSLGSVGASSGFGPDEDTAPIDPLVSAQLQESGRADIFVKMASDADLASLEGISSRAVRLRAAYLLLNREADGSQAELRSFLSSRGVDFQIFWINNSLFIPDAGSRLVQRIAARDDVAYIRGNHDVPLVTPVLQAQGASAPEAVEWNIDQINAPDVWGLGNTGAGVVVANIDTGVRYTHEALISSYRGNAGAGAFDHDYNWWDPQMSLAEPTDAAGHGSHTMGTMIGGDGPGPQSNDIGVAPGAQWIAAKGCGFLFCSDFNLISSAQWIACPTRVDGTDPDCSKAPHIVNNSWGGGGGDSWYTSYVQSWLMAGIFPVFSAGNSGPSCNTVGSPGDYTLVAGVGATDSNDVLAEFSSKGPGTFRLLKPDFVAPGEAVRSSVHSGDAAYAVFSGTSMAAPHVAGTLALLISADPSAGLVDMYRALSTTAVQSLGTPPGATSCGGREYNVYPNAIYGWGRIDALAALGALP